MRDANKGIPKHMHSCMILLQDPEQIDINPPRLISQNRTAQEMASKIAEGEKHIQAAQKW